LCEARHGRPTASGPDILKPPPTCENFPQISGIGLRLGLLELDGVPIAGDLACAFRGQQFQLKTGFDEKHANLSPGLVLRAETLRRAISDGIEITTFSGYPLQDALAGPITQPGDASGLPSDLVPSGPPNGRILDPGPATDNSNAKEPRITRVKLVVSP
jgi:Acetyltransferase (GNAT) domain